MTMPGLPEIKDVEGRAETIICSTWSDEDIIPRTRCGASKHGHDQLLARRPCCRYEMPSSSKVQLRRRGMFAARLRHQLEEQVLDIRSRPSRHRPRQSRPAGSGRR